MATCLYVGRFQPFHLGHLCVIEWLSHQFEEVVIAIGSGDKSFTKENPFTAGERYEMIRETLRARLPNVKFSIMSLEDTPNNAAWLANLRQAAPPFDVVCGNNAGVLIHFQATGYKTISTEKFNRDKWVGSQIRKLLVDGEFAAARDRVPSEVWDIIERVGGAERLLGLHGFNQD